jgi:endoglucanase
VLSTEEMDKVIETDKLFIDAGLSEEQALVRVPPGTPVVFAGGCECLHGSVLSGRAMDDRACVAIVIRVMELLQGKASDADLYCLLAVQEELGTRGASVGAFSVDPDMAVVLDVTHAQNADEKREERTFPMGKGGAIGVGPNMSRRLSDRQTHRLA